MEAGASSLWADERGTTVVDLAARSGDEDCLRLVLYYAGREAEKQEQQKEEGRDRRGEEGEGWRRAGEHGRQRKRPEGI
eukprot:985928-Rhodomonas_salina.1